MPLPVRKPRQGVLGGVLVTLLGEGVALPAGVITAAVLTRGLGPEIYGGFIVVASSVATLEWLLIAILARPVVKFVAEATEWRPVAATSFRAFVFAGLAIGAAIWGLAGAAAAALNDPSLAAYFRLYAPEIPIFAAGAACKGILAGRGRYREQAASSAVGWIGRMLFIVTFVGLGYGVKGAIVGSICGMLVGALMALALAGRAVWGRAGFPFKDLMQLALPAFLAMLFARLLDQVGMLALKVLGNQPAEVGYYGAAMNVLMVTSLIAAAVTPALVSGLTAARRKKDDESVRRIAIGVIRFSLFLFPFAALVSGASPEVVDLLFGSDFGPAAPLMALLIVGAVARSMVVVIAAVLLSLDKAWHAAILAAPLPILAVAAHTVVIPRYGAQGAAVVSATLAVAGAIVSLFAVCWISRLPVPWATLLRSATIFAAAYFAAAAWPTAGTMLLVKLGLLSLGVVAAFLLAGELSREEIEALRRSLPGSRA